jgi:hypothetical protein
MAINREDLLADIIYTRIDLAICLLTREDDSPDEWDISMAIEYIIEAINKLELLL